jgi:hypothetical protein
MLRSVVLSATRTRSSIHITRPLLVPGFRFNSSQSSEERKALNKEKKQLQKDWASPILTYEQVKQKSQQPSEVRSCFSTNHSIQFSLLGCRMRI